MLNKFVLAAIAGMFALGMAQAQTAATAASSGSCEARAVGKNGKPLAGAAKASFLQKCKANEAKSPKDSCETRAIGSNGKPLAGAAKTSFLKKCEANAAK